MKYNQWPRVRIAELCELIVDCVNKTAPSVDYETPFKMIRTPNIKGGRINLTGCRYVEEETFQKWTRRATVDKGDVLLTREAPMGEVGYVDFTDTVFLGQRIMQYRADPKKLDSAYLLYSFLSPDLQYQFRRHDSTGSIVSHIRVPDCSEFEISVPALDKQKAIAGVLRNIDKKIDLNDRINAELEAMAKTLYDYWFVQFDFPDANGKPYKTSGGKMVYNATLKREIPAGWSSVALSKVTSITNQSLSPADYPDKIFNYYSIPTYDLSNSFGYEYGGNIGSSKFIVSENDILVSKLNPWFNRVIYTCFDGDAICSTEFVVWRTPNVLMKNFLYMIATSSQFIAHCTQSATGTSNSHKRVNPDIMMRYEISFDSNIAESLGEKLDPLVKKLIINQQENAKLIAIRDWLLPLLMNGQVTVK